jgi:hypothetical protein
MIFLCIVVMGEEQVYEGYTINKDTSKQKINYSISLHIEPKPKLSNGLGLVHV